jgi:ElaB/YqjD/DUF883 family membrane-anchored ribosome-binding protein
MTTQSRKRDRGINGGAAVDAAADIAPDTATATTGTSTGISGGVGQGAAPQQAASRLAEQAGRTVEAQANTLMDKACESLETVARAIREAGNNLREDRPEIASYADTAAQRVDGAAMYLREHDAREVIDNAQDFARRQPAVVVAGGLALGLLIGRFLRSGTPSQSGRYRSYGSDYGMPSSTYASGSTYGTEPPYSGTGSTYNSLPETEAATETAATGAGVRRKPRAGH